MRGRETVRLLRGLAISSALGAWVVIVIGGYVSQTGSGAGCPDIVLCGNPTDPAAAAIESAHRLAGWVEGLLVLGMTILVLWRYRAWGSVRNLTMLAFALVTAQAVLGILAVATGLNPLVVTAHLGVAAAFLAVTVLNAATVLRGTPPMAASASSRTPSGAAEGS